VWAGAVVRCAGVPGRRRIERCAGPRRAVVRSPRVRRDGLRSPTSWPGSATAHRRPDVSKAAGAADLTWGVEPAWCRENRRATVAHRERAPHYASRHRRSDCPKAARSTTGGRLRTARARRKNEHPWTGRAHLNEGTTVGPKAGPRRAGPRHGTGPRPPGRLDTADGLVVVRHLFPMSGTCAPQAPLAEPSAPGGRCARKTQSPYEFGWPVAHCYCRPNAPFSWGPLLRRASFLLPVSGRQHWHRRRGIWALRAFRNCFSPRWIRTHRAPKGRDEVVGGNQQASSEFRRGRASTVRQPLDAASGPPGRARRGRGQ